MARPRKVLITGAAGFIGQALRRRLKESGVPYVGAVRTLSDDEAGRGDCIGVGDFAAADWTHALEGVDVIVHLAGRADAPNRYRGDATPYVVANVHVTRRLLDAAARADVRRVLFASTVKIYGETTKAGHPFRAGDLAHPRDDYARTKEEAEKVLWQRCHASGMEGVVLRLPLTYGPGVKGNFLHLLEAIAAGRRLPFANVNNHRSLLYVGNAVTAIETALASPWIIDETLPIADAQSASTPELVERIARALGVPARLYPAPTWLLRTGAFLAGRRRAAAQLLGSLEVDGARFRELVHWMPPVTLDEGLVATAAWWLAEKRLAMR